MLTLKDEYTLVLGRKWTGLTWLFVLNRYVMLFTAIQIIAPSTPAVSLNPSLCSQIAYTNLELLISRRKLLIS